MEDLKSALFILLFIMYTFTGCTEDQPEILYFTDRIPQNQKERTILAELSLHEIVNLTGFGIFSTPRPKFIGESLMWVDFRAGQLVGIDPASAGELTRIGYGLGNGPGEVGRINGFVQLGDTLVMLDGGEFKLIFWDPDDGSLLGEESVEKFRMDQLEGLGGGRLVGGTTGRGLSLFYITDNRGTPLASVADSADHVDHMMKLSGYITADEESFYFAGYSEPLIRGYSAVGELLFSRAMIDNYDTSDQYRVRSFGNGGVAWGFADNARYAALQLQNRDGVIMVSMYHNGEHDAYFIDLYRKADGEYIGSWQTDRFIPGFDVRENRLYGVYLNEEEEVILAEAEIERWE